MNICDTLGGVKCRVLRYGGIGANSDLHDRHRLKLMPGNLPATLGGIITKLRNIIQDSRPTGGFRPR